MKQGQILERQRDQQSDDGEISLVELLIVMAKHKRLLIGLPVAAAVLSAAVSMVLPNVYQASTKLLPPQQAQSGAAALLSQLGGMAGAAAGAAGIKNPNEVYVGMLKSRTIADKLIAKYDLKKHYGAKLQEDARLKLEASTNISSGKDNLITIDVEDKDQQLVARLANSYVDELVQLNKVVAVTEAAQRRMFYERQLEQAKNNLAKTEAALKGALDSGGMVSVDADSRAALEIAGRLRAEVSAKEIQLNSMRAFVTDSNPDYRRTEEELNSLRAELSKMENGRHPDVGATSASAKQSGIGNIQLLRDLKYYQMLYELLAKQYEVARLDEAKDSSMIQVLDPAIEPERKYKPHRSVIVFVSTMLALFAAIGWAFISDLRQKTLASEAGSARWAELKSQLRFK